MTKAKHDQGDATHDAPINSPHVLDSREVQASVGFEGDVGFQLSIFAIQSFELGVPLDANKPSNPNPKT